MPKITQQVGGIQPKKKIVKGGSVLDRIQNVTEFVDNGCKVLIYGASDTGKTTLLGGFRKPMLIAIASGASETRSIKNINGIEAVTLNNETELKQLCEEQERTGKWATFAVDHVSGFQDLVIAKVLDVAEAPTQLSWGTLSQNQWGDVAMGMKDHIRRVLNLNCDSVIISQERDFNTDGESSGILAPYVNCAVTKSVVGWIGPNVDFAFQTFKRMKEVTTTREVTVAGKKSIQKDVQQTGEVEFCLRLAPHPIYYTKYRAVKGTKVPDILVNPDYQQLAKLFNWPLK